MNGADFQMAEKIPGAAPSPDTPTSEARAAGAEVDVVVIGGGIQGAGAAQAAAAAGFKVALLERREAAIGTSSRSSKLIHGGLRYLESYQFSLVRESLEERQTLLKIAPHLVRLVPFHIPVYRDTRRSPLMIRAGLSLYAALGNLRPSARFESLPRRDWDGLDGLQTDGLRAVFRYQDGQTDDAALCRAVLSSAIDLGALVEVGAEVRRIERPGGASRWQVHYDHDGVESSLHARVVINAAGPWVNRVAALATPGPPIREVDLVGGTHIELPGHLDRGIFYTEAPSDQRAVFSIPWRGHVMVGTTETPFTGDPATVAPTEQEIDYLLGVHRRYFPHSLGEVSAAWAGLRVLPRASGSAFSRPRDVTLVTESPERPSWVSVYGGKLTGYRHTAERILRRIAPTLGPAERVGPARRIADTRTLSLPDLERLRVWD
ncbi:FAD-dependent oxidoreductase [Planctomycetota bacterium]|nr:FAD-dependent oxidoreductase [Planctomycetota bacterium]